MDDIFQHYLIFMNNKIQQTLGIVRVTGQISEKIFDTARKIGLFKVTAPDSYQHISIGIFFNIPYLFGKRLIAPVPIVLGR